MARACADLSPQCVTGVEPSGNVATQPTTFVVETVRAGQGDLSVSVKGPTGEADEVRCFIVMRGVRGRFQKITCMSA